MKKTSFILLFLMLATFAFAGKTKVIVNPAYEVKNTGLFHVAKIELRSTETRVYIHNTFIPKWWVEFTKDEVLKDTETGKTYQVTGIEGAEFDKKLWMPASGDSTIVLIFPALDKGTRKIDYNNQIFGISLEKNKNKKKATASVPATVSQWLKNEVAGTASKQPVDLNAPSIFEAGTGRLVGYIKGYDTRLGFTTGIIYTNDAITRADFPTVVQIHPDGRFEATLPMNLPKYTRVEINDRWIPFYLEPGQTLAMILDWEEFLTADRLRNIRYQFRNLEYGGALAKINSELAAYSQPQYDNKAFQKKIATLSPDEFKKDELAAQAEQLRKVEEYTTSRLITLQAATILTNRALLTSATELFDFVMRRSYESSQDTANKILKLPVPNSYYDFLQKLPLQEPSLLVLDEYAVFINRFEFSDPMRRQAANTQINIKPEKTLLAYLLEEKIKVPDEDKKLFLLAENPATFKDIKPDLLAKLNDLHSNYQEHAEAYYQKYYTPLYNARLSEIALEQWQLKDKVLQDVLQLEPNLTYDITKIRSLKFLLANSTKAQGQQLWDGLKVSIKHPYLLQTGDGIINNKFQDEQALAYTLPTGIATDVFKKIIDPFKGKVLFVDFWATSCGPCVGNIKQMKAIREEHKNNQDFAFLFITDEGSSPEAHYTKFVEEQTLTNTFRLSKDEFNYLRQLFKFNGIPRYVVIDKQGNVVDENFEMHNFKYKLSSILTSNN